jgi:hypothetical protein
MSRNRKRQRAPQRPHPKDEPRYASEDVVEWGDQLILAVDFTEGGAPIGLTVQECRALESRDAGGAGWAIAKRVLETVSTFLGVDEPEIGWVDYLGSGLTHAAYGAECLFPDGSERPLVVRLPLESAERDRHDTIRGEVRVLLYLDEIDLPFRIPRFIAAVPIDDGVAIVQEWVGGIPVDLRADRFPGGRPWEFVATIAAALHAVDPEPLRPLMSGHATRRDHAVGVARVLVVVNGACAEEARGWAR